VVLWRAGLRVQEALALAEHDLDPRRGSVLVRNGKGGRRREVGIDEWAGSTSGLGEGSINGSISTAHLEHLQGDLNGEITRMQGFYRAP
jgi:hypothetical protein